MSDANKQRILREIKRTAEANGGIALGKIRFSQETGIRQTDWYGKIWIKWSDALEEAGFQPNELQTAFSDHELLEKFVELIRSLGHYPVAAELRIKRLNDASFPSHNTFSRFGAKQHFAQRIIEFCKDRGAYDDVIALCTPLVATPDRPVDISAEDSRLPTAQASPVKAGYVYLALLRFGRERRYKIGKAILVERRIDQVSIQLPEDLELVHTISTDDAYGIESYWHRRFAAKNTKGEWFVLDREDVAAFKRRRSM